MIDCKTLLVLGVAAVLASSCSRADKAGTSGDVGVLKTGFPGEVTAGGGTSGEVLARAGHASTDASYTGGTPGIAGGSGGSTGGVATGGTVQETGHGPSGSTAPPAAKPTPWGK